MYAGPTSMQFVVRGRHGELWSVSPASSTEIIIPPSPPGGQAHSSPSPPSPASVVSPHILSGCPPTITSLGLGPRHRVAVDGEGHVWGQGALLPDLEGPMGQSEPWVRVPDLAQVTQVACGLDWTVALTEEGQVWAFASTGDGSFQGQLGLNHKNRPGPRPTRVPGLPPVRRLACGASFALAEDEEGQLWVWGDNNSGQLGRGDFHQELAPHRLRWAPEEAPARPLRGLTAGGDSAVLVDAEGGVWASGQLGCGEEDQPRFQRVEGPQQVVKAVAGGAHTLVLDVEGRVWGWGHNQRFPLGGGQDAPPHQPPMLLACGGRRVVDVAAGLHFSLLQTEADELFYMGLTEEATRPPCLPCPSSISPMLMVDRMKRPKSACK